MAEDPEELRRAPTEISVQQPATGLIKDEEYGNETEREAVDQNGHHHNQASGAGEDEERTTGSPPNASREKQFEVTFDGDKDPLNPKNKSKLQKWIITLIVSSCSFCV